MFDFLLRTKNRVTAKEVNWVERTYMNQFGNPYEGIRKLPPSEYDYRGRIVKRGD